MRKLLNKYKDLIIDFGTQLGISESTIEALLYRDDYLKKIGPFRAAAMKKATRRQTFPPRYED